MRFLYHLTRPDSHLFFRLDTNLCSVPQNRLDNHIGNILRPHWITIYFTINPYVTYHNRNSKEFIQLKRGAMIDFQRFWTIWSYKQHWRIWECMDRNSKLYAYYGYIFKCTTKVTVATDGTVRLGNHANLIETWNRFGLETVLNNVNMKWGDK